MRDLCIVHGGQPVRRKQATMVFPMSGKKTIGGIIPVMLTPFLDDLLHVQGLD